MGAIRILPEVLVNRIAAGEVIERPAAAVKELVENALDAGAARVSVTLEGGGIDRIVVEDDGCGMDAGELVLAVQRHGTSKLLDDTLVRIATLGFRGEALPSIGAAARLIVVSRPRGGEGARIVVDGGRTTGPVPAAAPPGTRVVVEDLFHATPARRKFLKAPRTEGEHAEAAVRRLAFAAPGVAMRCTVDGRVAFDLPAQGAAARVSALLGAEAASVLRPVVAERGEMRLTGYAALPAHTRATAVAQSLVVNGRPVADPVLRTAVRVAYREVIERGRHGVVALSLEVPPETVDVNVHPAKTELRFQDAAGVRSLVISAVRAALAGGAMAAPAYGARPQLRLVSSRGGVRPMGFAEQALPLGEGAGFGAGASMPPGVGALGAGAGALGAGAFLPLGAGALLPLGAGAFLPLGAGPGARVVEAPALPVPEYPLGAAVAQVLDTYVLAVNAEGALVLVDQHAAHERLTHEALRAQRDAGGVRAQPLLLPEVVDLPHAAAGRLLDAAPELAGLGLELEGFGAGAVLVRALPAALGGADPAPLLRDIADALAEGEGAAPLEARLDAALARMACHGSIRAGRRLSQAEMDALLRQMEATPRAATCSHGRPTVLTLSRTEIEALFGRR